MTGEKQSAFAEIEALPTNFDWWVLSFRKSCYAAIHFCEGQAKASSAQFKIKDRAEKTHHIQNLLSYIAAASIFDDELIPWWKSSPRCSPCRSILSRNSLHKHCHRAAPMPNCHQTITTASFSRKIPAPSSASAWLPGEKPLLITTRLLCSTICTTKAPSWSAWILRNGCSTKAVCFLTVVIKSTIACSWQVHQQIRTWLRLVDICCRIRCVEKRRRLLENEKLLGRWLGWYVVCSRRIVHDADWTVLRIWFHSHSPWCQHLWYAHLSRVARRWRWWWWWRWMFMLVDTRWLPFVMLISLVYQVSVITPLCLPWDKFGILYCWSWSLSR